MDKKQRAKRGSKSATGPKRMPDRLAGRAGLSLVEFQLGRRGFEFVRMPLDSKSGDIWAETGVGRISIEVKTTVRGQSWFVKSNQTNSEFFVLTNLDEARCYVLTSDEMLVAISNSKEAWPGVYVVFASAIPDDALDGWKRLGGRSMNAIRNENAREPARSFYKSTRIVRHTLVDGTDKIYKYPPISPKNSDDRVAVRASWRKANRC